MPLFHEALLRQARTHAESARFAHMLDACQQIVNLEGKSDTHSAAALLDVGALLLNFGFLTRASHCFERVRALAPADLRPLVNLANLARDAGNHAESRRLYSALHAAHPDHPVIRRNLLVSQEYDPAVTDDQRLDAARAWGDWASARAGGERARPPLATLSALAGRPLRVGYVSADFCQHTVGLFVKDVLAAHDPARISAFAYSASLQDDWVSEAIKAACQFRSVAALDDAALAALIKHDQIDVLVDLSGHTAGSRLSVFACRPAPVQVSWLGYFASTGLACMDAVLLDDWHAPPGTETQFVEPVIRLPAGRFCFQPVPWAPAGVSPLPCLANGYITFGCFNNTAKFNNGVFDVWARVLASVPASRLVLKWRSFNDTALRQKVTGAFVRRGIALDRIELRGPSFHSDLLKEYADIDIALDPFPVTGGLTSCEALWMGVPVVSWPQSPVVSRQTFALLSQVGLPELAAPSADGYVEVARSLAADRPRLAALRAGLRAHMQASALMDVAGFTRQLEHAMHQLFIRIAESTPEPIAEPISTTPVMHANTLAPADPKDPKPLMPRSQSYQAISRERHGEQRWQRPAHYAFAAGDALVPLTAAELPKAVLSLPLAFIEQAGAFVPVAVLGLQPGSNLFVTPDQRWAGNYIPAAFRSYPFRLAPTGDGQQALCIDEASGLVTSGLDSPAGERFFDEDGQPAQAVRDMLNFLHQIEQSRLATAAACAALHQHGLIRPWPITVKTDAGEQQVAGLYQTDEAALGQLPGDALHQLAQAGALAVAYCQLLSMQHLPALGALAQARAQAAQEQAKAALQPARDLDLEFLKRGDTISFGNLF